MFASRFKKKYMPGVTKGQNSFRINYRAIQGDHVELLVKKISSYYRKSIGQIQMKMMNYQRKKVNFLTEIEIAHY